MSNFTQPNDRYEWGHMQRPPLLSTTQNIIDAPETCAGCREVILDEVWVFVQAAGYQYHYHGHCAAQTLFSAAHANQRALEAHDHD